MGVYKSVHIVDTNSSEIVIAQPIDGPVHVTQCHDSFIFISSCRQLRIHDCSNVTFILHVSSGPIIEHCKLSCIFVSNGCMCYLAFLRFMHPAKYMSIIGTRIHFYSNDCALSSLGPNMYYDVKDFNWLKKIKSPNYESFSNKDSLPTPFGNIDINENSVIVLHEEIKEIQTKEDDVVDDVQQSYSSDDEL